MKFKLLALIGATCSIVPGCSAAPTEFDPGGFPSMHLAPLSERTRKPEGIEVEVWPSGILETARTHYLTSGALTSIIMPISNPDSLVLKAGKLSFDLPASVSFELPSGYINWQQKTEEEIERDGKPYKRYTLLCTVHLTTIPGGKTGAGYFDRSRPVGIWVKTTQPSGTDLGKLYLRFSYRTEDREDFVDSRETWVNLKASPPLSAAQPKLVESGVMGRFNINLSNNPKPIAELALGNYFRQLGYNFATTHVNLPAESGVKQWREAPIQNVLEFHAVPEPLRFVLKGKVLDRVVTPSAIYRRDPWVVSTIFDAINKAVSSSNVAALWMNLEPYAYFRDGDQSERNRDEFITWSKLPAADVKAVWPNQVAEKFPEQWKRFLNWQLEQCTRTFSDVIAKAGTPYATKPFFAYATANDWIWNDSQSPVSILRWGDMPVTLQSWNFRFVPSYAGNKLPSDRPLAPQLVRSHALAADLEKSFGPQPQMRIGCLYGWDQTGNGGFFFPEQLEFLHTATALAGSTNVQNYAAWPVWDGRYATAIANANTRIARWEEFTVQGKKQRKHVVIPVTPYPQKVEANITPADQEDVFD